MNAFCANAVLWRKSFVKWDPSKQPYLLYFLIEKSFAARLTVVGKLQCSPTPQLKILLASNV